MYKLLLVQPVDSYGPNKFLPLAISYQWMYATTSQWVKENWSVVDVLIDKPTISSYVSTIDKVDMVAMSCYVWNWSYNLELAKQIKQKFPNCRVVIGGPHVDKRNNSFFKENPQIDYAITGEGEIAFKELLKSYQGTPIKAKNFFGKEDVIDFLPERLDTLDEIPSPILEGFYDQIFEMYKDRVPKDTLWQVTFETLRGCPYHCAFCDIGDSYWNKVKTFDMERVKKEIDWMAERKIEYISVCDSNWGMLPRDEEITEYVIQKKKETGYPKIWDVTWAKNNSERIFEIAKNENDNGTHLFKGVTFAMQSFNEKTLIATDRFNIKEDQANKYLLKYKKEDIPTYSELIWPMPNETYDSLKYGIQRLIDLGQKDFLMVHPLVLTPNAPMGQPSYKKAYGLKSAEVPLDTFYLKVEDPENYVIEMTEAVYETNSASYDEVVKGMLFSYLFITMYYYGWAHALMEYFNSKLNVSHTSFIDKMLAYFLENKGIISSELEETKSSFLDVFQNKGFWGRKPFKESDIYWDYKSASAIVFDLNRKQLTKELTQFVKDEYNFKNKDLMKLNENLCYDYRKTYPYSISIDKDIAKHAVNVEKESLILDHWDKTIANEKEFHHVAYHYQRKNRYWRCTINKEENNENN